MVERSRARLSEAGAAMRVRSYRWWFFSQVLSSSGSMTQAVALSWLVLRMTGNAFLLALTTTAMFAPSLLGGAMAGSLVDRFDRRRLLLCTQSAFFSLGASLGALMALGQVKVWVIFAFAFANGVVNCLDAPARQLFVLDLVGPERAANAVSLNEVVVNTSRVLGPALGGILLATVGVAVCFFANAVSFLPPLAVVLTLLRRRGWSSTQAAPGQRRRGHSREGLVYAWRQPAIRSCIFFAVAGGMLFNMGNTLPLLALRAFHTGPQGYGLMMAAFGGGALFGAVLAGAGGSWPSGRRVRALVLATGMEVCLTAAAPWVGLLYLGLALAGLLSIWFIALANALVQLRSEPELRGRVMGVWTMALPGMLPITSLAVGAVATWGAGSLGAREGFGLAGVALVASALVGWRALADRAMEGHPMGTYATLATLGPVDEVAEAAA
jgi:MFS family permease